MDIKTRNEELQGNIKQYSIYQIVIDSDGKECIITKKTSSSIEIYIEKKKTTGVNCKQWFYIKDFEKRFKPIDYVNIPKSEKVLSLIKNKIGDKKVDKCKYVKHPEYGTGLNIEGEGFCIYYHYPMIDK